MEAKETAAPQRPYTVAEFSKLAGLGRASVYSLIARGELPALRFGGAIRLPREKCDRLLRGEARLKKNALPGAADSGKGGKD